MSIDFGFVWGLILLPLPLLVRRLPPAAIDSDALWVPFFSGLDAGGQPAATRQLPERRILIAWLLLIGALVQPVVTLDGTSWALFRPLLLMALMIAMSAGFAVTRRVRPKRRLPERYHRDEGT